MHRLRDSMSADDLSKHLPPSARRRDARLRPEPSEELRTPAKAKCSQPGTPTNSLSPAGHEPAHRCEPRRLTHPEPGGERMARNQAEPHPGAQPRAATKPAAPPHAPAGSCPRLRPEDIRRHSRIRMGAGAVSVSQTSGPDSCGQPEDPARRRGGREPCLRTWVWD